MKKAVIYLILLLFSNAFAGVENQSDEVQWQLWDVSILLPLPKSDSDLKLMISPYSSGLAKLLLPKDTFHSLPQIVVKVKNELVFSQLLKVIAVRIDPCFQEGSAPQSCRRQIRFVWQPVFFKNNSPQTIDAALHSSYELSEPQWNEFLLNYEKLKQTTNKSKNYLALDIHPTLKEQGYEGNFWLSLKDLLLKYCGEKSLTQITVMTLEGAEDQWVFSGIKFNQGLIHPIMIPKVFSTGQTFMAAETDTRHFQATVAPIKTGNLGLWFFDNSRSVKNKFTESEFKVWVRELLEVENPLKHNSGTTDCISCHISTNVLNWHRNNFDWNWTFEFSNSEFKSSRNLFNKTLNNWKAQHMRAFGYQNTEPRFSQRVINESAVVVDWLEKNEF